MHFIITFGFLIPAKPDTNIENVENLHEKKVKQKKKPRRKEKQTTIDEFETTESKKNIINIKQLLAEIHVEYDLLPGYTFKFDCRCWDTATKVYTEYGDWSLRPIPCPVKDNALWVVFSVHHLVHLNDAQLRKYFNYVITYRISYGKEKFSERAKKDKVKGFYVDDESFTSGQNDFLEIYPLDVPEFDSVTKKLSVPVSEPLIIKDETDGDFSVATYLDVIPDSVHQCKFWKMAKKERFPSESLKIQLSTPSSDVLKELKPKSKSSKKSKKSARKKKTERSKSKKQKQKKETTQEIYLSAETLFSGMGTITSYNRTSQTPNDSSVLIYIQCEDILSDKKLRMNLNPISIKLEQLSHFPSDVLIENNFSYLYAKIIFAKRTIITAYYNPAGMIYFEFIKCYLFEEFESKELISSLATEFLIVEIIGVRLQTSEGSAKEVLLGVATFDLSELVKGWWEVRLTNSLYHPRAVYCPTIHEPNDEKVSILEKDSPLTSNMLMSFGTCLKVKVRVAYDLRAVYQDVLHHDGILNRIFIILNDLELAREILNDALAHNHNLLFAFQSSEECMESEEQDAPKGILTGFVIDCCDKFYMFFEGLSNGYLVQLWEKVATLPVLDGCVHYNSSHIFLTRLYEDFIPLNGIIEVRLSESLETQLQKCGLYVGKTGATIKATVMRTMGLMKLATTMKSLCQERLIPNSRVMNSFMDEIHEIYFEKSLRDIIN